MDVVILPFIRFYFLVIGYSVPPFPESGGNRVRHQDNTHYDKRGYGYNRYGGGYRNDGGYRNGGGNRYGGGRYNRRY